MVIGSPHSNQLMAVDPGDWVTLSNGLGGLGVEEEALDELSQQLNEVEDQGSRVHRAIEWAGVQAKKVGISAAGGPMAGLLLQYLGAV